MNDSVLTISGSSGSLALFAALASILIAVIGYNVFCIIYDLKRRPKLLEAEREIMEGHERKANAEKGGAEESPGFSSDLVENQIEKNKELYGKKKQEEIDSGNKTKSARKAKTLDKQLKKAEQRNLKKEKASAKKKEAYKYPETNEEFMLIVSDFYKQMDEIENLIESIDLENVVITNSPEMDAILAEEAEKARIGSSEYKRLQKKERQRLKEDEKKAAAEERLRRKEEIRRKSKEEASVFDEEDGYYGGEDEEGFDFAYEESAYEKKTSRSRKKRKT